MSKFFTKVFVLLLKILPEDVSNINSFGCSVLFKVYVHKEKSLICVSAKVKSCVVTVYNVGPLLYSAGINFTAGFSYSTS